MSKRAVETSFWEDEKVVDYFSPEDKYFMMYLLTNPRTASIGIYKFPKKIVAFELGYTQDSVNVLLDRFEHKYNLIRYDSKTQEVAVLNGLKYNISKGGSPIEQMVEREIKNVKSSQLILATFEKMSLWWEQSGRAIDDAVKTIFENELFKRKVPKENNTNTNTNTNTDSVTDSWSDSENKDDIPYKEIIDYLNDKAKTNYRASGKDTKSHIKARWNEGFNLDDFKTVIDKQVARWTNTEYQQYLRPKTLFGTKFESYLNSPEPKKSYVNEYPEDMPF